MLYKRYVSVIALVDKDGKLTPLEVVWENGVRYPIDKVTKVRQAASVVGGCGILYECLIESKRRNLFYERNRWFIESTKP